MKGSLAARSRSGRLLFPAYAALTVYFTAPLLVTGHQLGIQDWDVLLLYHAAVLKSVYEYGVLPFWNPWYCGGNVLWQNPQVALLSPTYLFTLITSLPFAMKLNIFIHYLLGFAGMHILLTRALRLSYWPAVLFLGSVFVLAGGMVMHLAVGHATFLPYFYLPWLLFFFLQALTTGRLRYVVAAGALVAVAIYNGGIHMSFMAGMGLACFAGAASLVRRDWRPLAMLAGVGILAFLFAAPKLLPVQAFVGNPRTIDTRNPPARDAMSAEMVMRAFLDPFQFRRLRVNGQGADWHEYGNYIGSAAALAIVASFLWILWRRPWQRERWVEAALAATALGLFLLGLGEFGALAPFEIVQQLPVASRFRLPSRYLLVFVLFAVAMIAAVLRDVPVERLGEGKRFVTIVLVLATASLAYWNHIQFEGVFHMPPLQSSFSFLARPEQPVVDATTPGWGGDRDSPMLRAMMQNRAVLFCYEPFVLPGGVDPSRAMIFPEDDVRLEDIEFAPGRIGFRALSPGGGRVFLNQRYVEGWHSDAGDFTVHPDNGLAYVSLPAGAAGRFTFWYAPPGLFSGILLCAAGIGLSAAAWRRTLGPAELGRSNA